MDFNLGEILQLRKPHPCGGTTWVVVRLGAEIGVECTTCKRRLNLSRRELIKHISRKKSQASPQKLETQS